MSSGENIFTLSQVDRDHAFRVSGFFEALEQVPQSERHAFLHAAYAHTGGNSVVSPPLTETSIQHYHADLSSQTVATYGASPLIASGFESHHQLAQSIADLEWLPPVTTAPGEIKSGVAGLDVTYFCKICPGHRGCKHWSSFEQHYRLLHQEVGKLNRDDFMPDLQSAPAYPPGYEPAPTSNTGYYNTWPPGGGSLATTAHQALAATTTAPQQRTSRSTQALSQRSGVARELSNPSDLVPAGKLFYCHICDYQGGVKWRCSLKKHIQSKHPEVKHINMRSFVAR